MLTTDQLDKFSSQIMKSTQATPYMITDLDMVAQKCQEFRHIFPDIDLYYAVKAFSDDEVIKHIDGLLDGYDVASVTEIRQLIKLGIAPARMTYSNPIKSPASIKEAVELGVGSFAYQSKEELEKITQCTKKSITVYLRLKVSDETSELSFSSKFGCEPDEAVELLLDAKNRGLKPKGLTFHVGSQATFSGVWDKALSRCSHIIEEAAQHDIKLEFINLGGGFPIQYKEDQPQLSEVGATVHTALKEHTSSFESLTLLAEPGRLLVGDSSVIVTTIIGVEKRGGTTWLFLDVGSFQAFVEIFEFEYFPYPVHSLRHLKEKTPINDHERYVLTGPSCDSFDTMATAIDLPTGLKVGDQLMITMTGAYTVVYGSAFNGFPVPPRMFIK